MMLKKALCIAVFLVTSATISGQASDTSIPTAYPTTIYWDSDSGWTLNLISYGRSATYVNPQPQDYGIQLQDYPTEYCELGMGYGGEPMFKVRATGISAFDLFNSGNCYLSHPSFSIGDMLSQRTDVTGTSIRVTSPLVATEPHFYDEFEEVNLPGLGDCVIGRSVVWMSATIEGTMTCGYDDPENWQFSQDFVDSWNYYNFYDVRRDLFEITEDWYE